VSQLSLESEDGHEALGRNLRLIAKGDHKAFEVFYQEWFSRIYRYLVTRGRPQDMTEETLQDIFVAIWRNSNTFRGE
jgi:DNA-directed RNA polymerase specialized sigma24 family protein